MQAVTRRTDDETPCLNCSACDYPLFPAVSRNGHAMTCQCGSCFWTWQEVESVLCECGAECRLDVDNGIAYVSEVEP